MENKEETKHEPRCDPEQLAILKRCSKKKDMTEWTEWLYKNRNREIWLEGADLVGAHLEGALLMLANLECADLRGGYLEGADIRDASLKGAMISPVSIGKTMVEEELRNTNLKNARLGDAVLSLAPEANREDALLALSEAEVNNVRFMDTVFGRDVRDEAWLRDYKAGCEGSRWRRFKRWVWGWSCDYGRSFSQ